MHFDTDAFFSWMATDYSGRGACGVSGESERAAALLTEALGLLAPGATGTVRLVRLDRHARQPSYIYGRTLLRLRRIKASPPTVIATGD
ncbi:hypothetical protein AB0H88_09970 [Nonomuraea sp. NPDC050680]|uniref:hypothetical protein n=1 Tax=Nonomuraea sp. NPDC050680 TaxID=3154630 RepID=UPI00340477F2